MFEGRGIKEGLGDSTAECREERMKSRKGKAEDGVCNNGIDDYKISMHNYTSSSFLFLLCFIQLQDPEAKVPPLLYN